MDPSFLFFYFICYGVATLFHTFLPFTVALSVLFRGIVFMIDSVNFPREMRDVAE